jgi:hypothetical protein
MNPSLASDAAAAMTAHLAPGERLLWAGQPKQGFALRGWDILYWPFSILMAVVGTILTVVELRAPSEPGAIVFALLAMLAGYYGTVIRYFVDRWQRSTTYYAVTDRRALILTRESPDYIQSIDLSTLKEVTYTRRGDNTGTLEFDRPSYFTIQGRYDTGRGASLPFMEPALTPAFEMIPNAREVRDLIVQTQHALQTP